MMRAARPTVALVVPAAWLFLRPITAALDEGPGLIQRTLQDNRGVLVTAGGLFVMGALAVVAERILEFTLDALRRKVTMSVQLDARDEAFRWVLEWLAENDGAKKCGAYVATVDPKAVAGVGLAATQPSDLVQYTPAPGTYLLRADSGKWLLLTRRRMGASSGRPDETLTVTMLGRDKAQLNAFIADAAKLCRAKDLQRTLIYTGGEHGSWNMAKARLRRPLQSVILDGATAEELLRDALEFLSSEAWYAERGVPWKRGYLLHGEPGSGKTSFVTALAGHLGLNIYSLSLGSAGMSDEALQSLMLTVPPRSLLLVEDIEVAFARGLGADAAPASQVTLSGLLNALDGVAAQEGCLLFLTTNYPAELPARLVRSGRVDVRVKFGLATKSQAQRLFRAFYPGAGTEIESLFVATCPSEALSMADLQGLLLMNKHDPAAAVRALIGLLEQRGIPTK